MQNDWYCQIDQKTIGPISAEQLKRLARAGTLGPADLVRKTATGKWMPARLVKGLPFPSAAPAARAHELARTDGGHDQDEDEGGEPVRGEPAAVGHGRTCPYCGNAESFRSFFTSGPARAILIAQFVINFVIALIFWQFARRWHRCSWCGFSSPPKWDGNGASVQPVVLGLSLAAPAVILLPGLIFTAVEVNRDQQVLLGLLLLLVLGGCLFGVSAALARQLHLNALAWGLTGAMTAGFATSGLALWWLLRGKKRASAAGDGQGQVKYSRSVPRERTFWGFTPGLQQRLGLMVVGPDLLIIAGPESLEKYRWPLLVGLFVVCWPLVPFALLVWAFKYYGTPVMDAWYAFSHGDADRVRSHPDFHVAVPVDSAACAFDGEEVRVNFPCSLLPKQPGWLPTAGDEVQVQILPRTLGASRARKFVGLCGGGNPT